MVVIYQPYLIPGVCKTIVNTEKHTKRNRQNGPWSGTRSAARLSLNTPALPSIPRKTGLSPFQQQSSHSLTVARDLSYLETQGTSSTNNRPQWPLTAVSAVPCPRADRWHLRAGVFRALHTRTALYLVRMGTQLQATLPLKKIKGLK